MSVTLEIPADVLATLPVPEPEREHYLFTEMVCLLYARGLVSLGRGAEMLGMSKFDFGLEAGRRSIPRHYSEADLEADLAYARG